LGGRDFIAARPRYLAAKLSGGGCEKTPTDDKVPKAALLLIYNLQSQASFTAERLQKREYATRGTRNKLLSAALV